MDKKRAVILGGGLTGLAAAEGLCKDFDVTVIEKMENLGGLAGSFEVEGKKIPYYYHHIFSNDYVTHEYLKKAGLFNDMNWKRIKMAICENGKIYDFTNPLALLKFKMLSVWGRVRYGLFGLYVLTSMNPDKIPEDMDAKAWLLKRAGKEVTEKLFYQLYGINKFNIPLENISAKQFASRLKAKEFLGVFGYPSKGLDLMIENMADTIRKRGGKILTGKTITKIDCKNKLIILGKEKIEADILINTIPIPTFLELAGGLPADYIKQLSKLSYCPIVGIVIGAKEFIGKHYWYNVLKERVHVIIQHSYLYDGYGEKIIWASRYGNSGQDLPLPDEKIEEEYLNAVKKYFPKIQVKWMRVFRDKYAEPVYDKDYPKYKPDYITPVKDVYHAGIAVTYPEIRNMNTALKSGRKIAGIIKQKYGA